MSAAYEPLRFDTTLPAGAQLLVFAAVRQAEKTPADLLDDMPVREVRAIREALVAEQERIKALAAAIGVAHAAITNSLRAPGVR